MNFLLASMVELLLLPRLLAYVGILGLLARKLPVMLLRIYTCDRFLKFGWQMEHFCWPVISLAVAQWQKISGENAG